MIEPAVTRAALGRMPIIACETTVLPDPDSPTSATVEPGRTEKETSRTASIRPSGRSNTT